MDKGDRVRNDGSEAPDVYIQTLIRGRKDVSVWYKLSLGSDFGDGTRDNGARSLDPVFHGPPVISSASVVVGLKTYMMGV